MTNSTVFTNTASDGGGIANGISGGTPNTLMLANVTVSDNSSLGDGGGLQMGNGTATVTYATFAHNRGEAGVERYGGVLNIKNSIITNSFPKNCEGNITSQGFNISNDYSCGFNQPGDHWNTNPKLEPLADNGSPTLTHLPQADSPAIDGGLCVTGIPTDQRGISRPQEAACDIGAVEVVIPPPPPPFQKIFLPLITRD